MGASSTEDESIGWRGELHPWGIRLVIQDLAPYRGTGLQVCRKGTILIWLLAAGISFR